MSIVLALAVVAVVVCAAPRRRRRTPSTAAVTVRSLGRHTCTAVRGVLAALAAGAVLLLFGQQASAQADETPEPPPVVQPTLDGTDVPTVDVELLPDDPADGSEEPGSPLADPVGEEGAENSGGVGAPNAPATAPPDGADASGAIASERCRHHAARLGHASRATRGGLDVGAASTCRSAASARAPDRSARRRGHGTERGGTRVVERDLERSGLGAVGRRHDLDRVRRRRNGAGARRRRCLGDRRHRE